MFGISGVELTIIIIFAFLVFGPDKLPGVIKNVTQIWNQLKSLREQADQVIKAEVVEPLKDIEATINPFVQEGISATEKLASKLGIKPEAQSKDGEKVEESKKAEALGVKGAEIGVAGAATSTAATTRSTDQADAGVEREAAVSVKPVKKKIEPEDGSKTESFAEKKARLEKIQREKLAAAEAKSSGAVEAKSSRAAEAKSSGAVEAKSSRAAEAKSSGAAKAATEVTAEATLKADAETKTPAADKTAGA